MADDSFFDEATEQSVVKATIVSKYFWAWAKVIIPSARKHDGRIAYIDLFAGPGRYKDGTKSTPILILEQAINDHDMREMLVTLFNDVNEDNSRSLENEINALPGITTLKYKPDIRHDEVGEEIVKMFDRMNLVPTLFFVDPWGYKGLSLGLINSVLKNWGCDCIIFFDYNRINMGITNEAVKEHMDMLFGESRADGLRQRVKDLCPEDRELAVVEEIAEALKQMGGKYVLPFCFKNAQGTRTSHHLIFVTKHFRGYEIMKGVMAKESSMIEQGVPSLAYNPADKRYPLLFELNRPLVDLEVMLLTEFAGKTLSMRDIYEKHSVGKPYIDKNYKEVLRKMEAEGKISAVPPANKRRKGTFANDVMVSFPKGN
jgi:three-Cys-motif partner protein